MRVKELFNLVNRNDAIFMSFILFNYFDDVKTIKPMNILNIKEKLAKLMSKRIEKLKQIEENKRI